MTAQIRYDGKVPATLRRYCEAHSNQIAEACGLGVLQDDAYDVLLRPGWRKVDDYVHSIIGTTVADTVAQLRGVVPCDCEDCCLAAVTPAIRC